MLPVGTVVNLITREGEPWIGCVERYICCSLRAGTTGSEGVCVCKCVCLDLYGIKLKQVARWAPVLAWRSLRSLLCLSYTISISGVSLWLCFRTIYSSKRVWGKFSTFSWNLYYQWPKLSCWVKQLIFVLVWRNRVVRIVMMQH